MFKEVGCLRNPNTSHLVSFKILLVHSKNLHNVTKWVLFLDKNGVLTRIQAKMLVHFACIYVQNSISPKFFLELFYCNIACTYFQISTSPNFFFCSVPTYHI
uniref:Uncharacterized protein n=1 Tax=Cacopsylla melanoneura TaxID=428564 RepID=A0A8D8UGE2_9HEMI